MQAECKILPEKWEEEPQGARGGATTTRTIASAVAAGKRNLWSLPELPGLFSNARITRSMRAQPRIRSRS